jgi:hypothetical protein
MLSRDIDPGNQRSQMAETEHRGLPSGDGRENMAGPSVVAYTTEDDEFRAVRQAAGAHAREHGCVLILYAADAAGFMSEPMPNAIDAEGAEDRFGDRVGLADLEYLGRAAIAGQVAEERATGARAAAWLPKGHGMEALAEYARSVGAHGLFLPGSLGPYDELVTRAGIEVHVVDTPVV